MARNDVGRVAEIGSVRVEAPLHIERYAHVMHLVSDVRGRLSPGLSAGDVLLVDSDGLADAGQRSILVFEQDTTVIAHRVFAIEAGD